MKNVLLQSGGDVVSNGVFVGRSWFSLQLGLAIIGSAPPILESQRARVNHTCPRSDCSSHSGQRLMVSVTRPCGQLGLVVAVEREAPKRPLSLLPSPTSASCNYPAFGLLLLVVSF